jgi:hypothetical protein
MGGAYNVTSALFFTDANGGAPRPTVLSRPVAGGDAGNPANLLINADFDPKSMVLTEFAKGRGIGDCGSIWTWLWTGRAFEPLDASRLEACPGALPEDWPNIYKATRSER